MPVEQRKRLSFTRHLAALQEREWVIDAKRPFAGPQQVLDYAADIPTAWQSPTTGWFDIENDQVSFRWKDYRTDGQIKTMTLSADEFIRRFLLHVLPNGLQRIRYYGFLGNRYREEKLNRCRRLLGMQMPDQHTVAPVEEDYRDQYEDLTDSSLRQCPKCQCGRMVLVTTLPRSLDYSPMIVDSS